METILSWLDFCGVAVFAASGALTASRKQLDIVGFCLIARRVFDKLTEQSKAAGRDSMWPIFHFEPIEGSLSSNSEDSVFSRKCAAAGR